MAWRTLDDLDLPLRRTWLRRIAAGVARTKLDPETGQRLVWTSWPGRQR
jgi:hypothetical protein